MSGKPWCRAVEAAPRSAHLVQHISYKLVARLADVYPDSSQVRLLHLEKASDSDVWHYARTHSFTIVGKDSDIVNLAVLRGAPPKVVWLQVGNWSTGTVEKVLRNGKQAIEEFVRDFAATVLEVLA